MPAAWTRRHLLGLEDLSAEEITLILDTAVTFKEATAGCKQKIPLLAGKTCANLFFEASTRTRTSFSLAARRLGADTVDFSASASSLSKGETFIDTAKNIEAMGIDVVIVRHRTPGTAHLLAQNLDCAVINAGDGPHEHPTQGLLDILTIRERRGRDRGADRGPGRRHRPQPHGPLEHLGAEEARRPRDRLRPVDAGFARWEELGVEVSHDLDAILPRCDVLNLLRIQFERQTTRPFPSVREYALLYAMNRERLAKAKEDILILAPGPINRGVEVTPDVADGPHSVIFEQVTNGLAVRMAVLWLILGGRMDQDEDRNAPGCTRILHSV